MERPSKLTERSTSLFLWKIKMNIDVEFLERAKWFATIIHHGQQYGNKPYIHHLEQVECVISRFNFDDLELRVAAWLHDSIEDVEGIDYKKIKLGFGTEIADIVFCVTNQIGRDRKEKFKYTYPKIKENRKALIVKLADRIANIENGMGYRTGYVNMYKKEWPEFYEALYDKEETDERVIKLWNYLKSLFEDFKNG